MIHVLQDNPSNWKDEDTTLGEYVGLESEIYGECNANPLSPATTRSSLSKQASSVGSRWKMTPELVALVELTDRWDPLRGTVTVVTDERGTAATFLS